MPNAAADMGLPTDETHDASIQSWVESANGAQTDFPIQNLPLGVFRRRASRDAPRIGVAIGDELLDLAACARNGVFDGDAPGAVETVCTPSLNALMALGPEASSMLRQRLHRLLRSDSPDASRNRDVLSPHLVPIEQAELFVAAEIGDYTDFYASIHHATNVGSMFRPSNPLLPNYRYVPVAYHGRASSIVVSGTLVPRPRGQSRPMAEKPPVFGPSQRLDYELEVGVLIGRGNALGDPVPIDAAELHIFGACLVNDWSARDIQAWEYQPLGPFLGKNFATSVSPWVVMLDALRPFRVPAAPRSPDNPAPLDHIFAEEDQRRGGIDLTVEVFLSSRAMRDRDCEPLRLSRGNLREMYWTVAQMIAHHTSNGCNLRAGDLIATGTISGPTKDSRGSLLELTWGGADPIALPTGESRRFLEDGDEVIFRGYCERAGFRRIGFGECRGLIAG
ncbi:MAG: fumarylacetoacetase [Terriglobia bacterium]